MSLFTDKSVEVEVIDNGWVFSWEDKTVNRRENRFTHSTMPDRPERGREVFSDKKKLIKRVGELV